MDELTLGLIGAGAVVVGGVVVYNAWQGAKVRRKMPRPMPADAEQGLARQDHEGERPFIEPAHAGARREPAMSDATHDSEGVRIEPSFGVSSPLDIPADIQAETTTPNGFTPESRPAEAAPGQALGEHQGEGEGGGGRAPGHEHEAIAPAATTISAAPPHIVDRRIDCVVPIRCGGPVSGEKASPLAQRLRRAGSKPVYIEGKPEGGSAWELLQNAQRYEELRAAVQLANRGGALNELEFSEFVSGVQQFADAIDGAPEFPDMLETVSMARELDAFAAKCDAQLSINVLSDGAPWSANYVQAVASQDGLLLSRDGTRFVKLDAKQSPVFMLQFGDTNFLRDDLTYKGGQMIKLILDVPVADEDILPFRLMCDYAKSLAERIGGRVVDDQRRPLPEQALLAIEKQLMTLYARLEEAGIPAGSPATRRLFSQ
jgi:hypothetical protein